MLYCRCWSPQRHREWVCRRQYHQWLQEASIVVTPGPTVQPRKMAWQHHHPQNQRLPSKQPLAPVQSLLLPLPSPPPPPLVLVHERGTLVLPAGAMAIAGAANPHSVAVAYSAVKNPDRHTRASANNRNGDSSYLWRRWERRRWEQRRWEQRRRRVWKEREEEGRKDKEDEGGEEDEERKEVEEDEEDEEHKEGVEDVEGEEGKEDEDEKSWPPIFSIHSPPRV